MLKRKRNALMADVNRGLKNNAYVLGSGIGAVTRFAYQSYLKGLKEQTGLRLLGM